MRSGCDIELISVGNELLLGNTVNTNASWIASHITSLGGRVTRITTVSDNLNEISRAVNEALKRRPTMIITTGGIGPTFDDMTLNGVARALKLRVRPDKTAIVMVREHYARRFPGQKLQLTKPRLKMASIPSGGSVVRNPVGTAPGVRLSARGIEMFCLPGVPKEAKAIFTDSVSRTIRSRTGGAVFDERWIHVRGIMESSLAPMIDHVMSRWPPVYIKSHPRGIEGGVRPHIELHFSVHSSNEKKAERALLGAVKDLTRELGEAGGKLSSGH